MNPAAYVTKAIGEWVQRTEGGSPDYWNNINEFQEADITITGGSGTGLQLRVRAEAQLNDAGTAPDDTRFKIMTVLNPGENYQVGDTMDITFPSPAPGGVLLHSVLVSEY